MQGKEYPTYSTADFFAIDGSPRRVFNFNTDWRFHKGDFEGAEQENFDDKDGQVVHLPNGLEILGENASGMRNYQGPAWYRKRFSVLVDMSEKRIVLYFEAVMGKATVWINGKNVLEHFGGYLPFAKDISELLYFDGRDNIVAVRADNSNDPAYPVGKPQEHLDFTYFGGIYRNVYLIATTPMHVSHSVLSDTVAGGGVFVGIKDVNENGNNTNIQVSTEVVNEFEMARVFTLRTILEDTDGKEILKIEETSELKSGESRTYTHHLRPEKVRLWHPDAPHLHYIRTELLEDEVIVDSLRTRFGIRLFEMRGDEGLFVNKKPIGRKLSGVNRHQDYAYVGNALPNSGQRRDAKLLREGGSSIIRAAHYPLSPVFMDACDELGLFVTVATPGWQFFNSENPIFEQRVKKDTRAMVRRDRNRPSVLLWETALNETSKQPTSMLKELHRIVHEEFPFEGAFTCTDVGHAKAAGFDFYFNSSMDEPKCSIIREYGDGEEVDNFYSQNAMTRVKREWGEQAMLNQALVRAKDLDTIYASPDKRIGATLWCGIDHQRGYHPDPFWGGLLDVYRLPRYSYFLFKSQYDPSFTLGGIETGPMVYIIHELTQVSGCDVVIFTNCDEVRLSWLGREIATQKPESKYRAMPHPPVIFRDVFNFHEISTDWRRKTDEICMIAEGIINGEVVCEQVKKIPDPTKWH